MSDDLAFAQALRYAEGLSELYGEERLQRRRAEDALARLAESYRAAVIALSMALELRDGGTGEHAVRVTRLALELTREVAPQLLDDPELEYGFLLHDLGKIGVSDAILLKPAPLDERERGEMERHPLLGERILAGLPVLSGIARDVVLSHHEHWDGRGYPHGLSGEAIPLAARIFAVVDSFDAITNDRPYRSARPVGEALAEIHARAGSQFDPSVAAGFVAMVFAREDAA